MFSTFKKFFGRQGAGVIDAPAEAPSAAPVNTSRLNPQPQRAARPETSPRPAAPVSNVSGTMSVPLKPVLSRLPAELKQRVRKPELGEVEISVPLQRVLTQIAQGSVKITFGELRLAAPPGTFAPEPDRDAVKVELPLNEILSRLDPALLPRRSAQKHVSIPAEITGPFGGQSKITFTTAPLKQESAPVAPVEPEPVEMKPLPQFSAPRAQVANPVTPFNPVKPAASPQPAPQKPVIVPFPASQPTAAQPTPAPARPFQPSIALAQASAASRAAIPSTSPAALAAPVKRELDADTPIFMRAAPMSQPAPVQPPTAPKPAAPQSAPVTPPAPDLVQMPAISAAPFSSLITPIAPAPEAEPAPIRFNPQPAAPAATPSIAGETRFLTVAIAELAGGWPGPVQQEIQTHQLMTSSVALPFGVIETAIKQGKVALPWRIIRSWIKPPAFITTSPNDPMMLELPLKIITPIFLAELKSAKPQKKLTVDESIPNLFANRLETMPSEPSTPGVAAFASAASSAPPPVAPLKPSDTNYFTRISNGEQPEEAAPPIKPGPSPGTAFLKRYATPNDIVSKAAAIPGVDGALIALPDGLLVASAVSPQVNAETIAGFLSQIYNRVNQCAKELRMGELNNLNFTVGNVPWKIFKVGAIYFAAFGRPGEPLPTAQLAAIAAELDRKAK